MHRGRQYPRVIPPAIWGGNYIGPFGPPLFAVFQIEFIWNHSFMFIDTTGDPAKAIVHLSDARVHWEKQTTGPPQPWLIIAEHKLIPEIPVVQIQMEISVPFGDNLLATWAIVPDSFEWGVGPGGLGPPFNIIATGRFDTPAFSATITPVQYHDLP